MEKSNHKVIQNSNNEGITKRELVIYCNILKHETVIRTGITFKKNQLLHGDLLQVKIFCSYVKHILILSCAKDLRILIGP